MNRNQRGRISKHKRPMLSKEKSDISSTKGMVVVPRESLLKWRKNYGFYQRVSKIFSIVCLGNIRFGKLAIVDTYKYTLKKKKASSYKFIM